MSRIENNTNEKNKAGYNSSNRLKSFETPQSVKKEHEELHSDLKKIIELGGDIGKSGNKVATILHPHFVKEEDYAMPPLGLLKSLVVGELNSDMEDALNMSRKLSINLQEMLEEHKHIVNALNSLINIAKKENNDYVEKFAKKLILHAQNEEEILYPAVILIGKYLELRLYK